jgi:hypothetical protein
LNAAASLRKPAGSVKQWRNNHPTAPDGFSLVRGKPFRTRPERSGRRFGLFAR